MTLFDLFQRDAVGPLDASTIPDDASAARIRRRAQELAWADERLARAEALVEAIKARRTHLATRVLPDLMDEAMTDTIGLPDANVDVVVQPYVMASIPKDWDEDRRLAAFAELEAHGGGSLPVAEVSVKFPKEELGRARRLQKALDAWLEKSYGNADHPAAALDLTVHWGSLTSWLKAELGRREEIVADHGVVAPLNLEKLGATVGRIAKVVERKKPKASKSGSRR